MVARRADRLQNLAEELRVKYGIVANFIVADLGNSADLQRVSDTISANSRVSVLVNNAGTASLAPSVDLLVLPASTATEIWDVAGIGVHALDQATVMTAEDCVDAALAALTMERP